MRTYQIAEFSYPLSPGRGEAVFLLTKKNFVGERASSYVWGNLGIE